MRRYLVLLECWRISRCTLVELLMARSEGPLVSIRASES